jgi:hypothetical protein
MEGLRNTVRKSKYDMIEMEKALEIMAETARQKFPIGVAEVDINSKGVIV